MKKPVDVLLINPPFSRPDEPVIGIATLAAYLKSRHINVEARDLSLDIFRRTVTTSRIIEERSYAEERFTELNCRSALDFRGIYEYLRLFSLLLCLQQFQGILDGRRGDFWQSLKFMGSAVRSRFLELATASVFPRFMLQAGPPAFSWHSPYRHFSKDDILASIEEPAWYSDALESIISGYLEEISPRIAAISLSYCNQILPAFQCAHVIRRVAPDAHISVGGSAAQIFFREVRKKELFTLVDTIATGDGEATLEALSVELQKKTPSMKAVPGIIYLSPASPLPAPCLPDACRLGAERRGVSRMDGVNGTDEDRSGTIVTKNDQAPPRPAEDLSFPDYTVFPLADYMAGIEDMRFPLRLSQGCSWGRCTFCRTELPMIKGYQAPPKERLFPMLMDFVNGTGCRKIHFADESIDPEAMEDISRQSIESRLSLDWNFQTRINGKINDRRCRLFREAGCSGISFGVESFSDRVLGLMRKGITAELVEKVLCEAGSVLPVTIFMVVGFPGETEEEARESFRKVREMVRKGVIHDYIYSPFIIHSGSPMMADPGRYGITELHCEPGSDLSPDIIEYQCTGMAREKVRELFIEFSRSREENQPWPPAVEIGGKTVRRRFDIEKMIEIITLESSMHPAMPLYRMITTAEASLAPESI
ncbi:MAG: B12-binding domain-containing radical SAM protein [Candidatus Xenobiia bacterium LiM19]